MALQYTGDQILKRMRDSGMLPGDLAASEGTRDSDLLEHLNDALLGEMIEFVRRLREEFFIASERTAVVSGQTRYRVSPRSMGNGVRDLLWRQGDNSTSAIEYLEQIDRSAIPYFGGETSSEPSRFYIEGNHIVLHPNGVSSGFLEVAFPFRPGQVQLQADVCQVTMIDTGTKTVTVDSLPTAWTTNNKFDLHSQYSGAEIHEWDLTSTGIGANTLTFSTAIDGSVFGRHPIEVGDYVCLAEEAALPGVPRECHPALIYMALSKVLLAMGDHDSWKIANDKTQSMLEQLVYALNPRVQGKPKIINNRQSLWRTSRGGQGGANSFGGGM